MSISNALRQQVIEDDNYLLCLLQGSQNLHMLDRLSH